MSSLVMQFSGSHAWPGSMYAPREPCLSMRHKFRCPRSLLPKKLCLPRSYVSTRYELPEVMHLHADGWWLASRRFCPGKSRRRANRARSNSSTHIVAEFGVFCVDELVCPLHFSNNRCPPVAGPWPLAAGRWMLSPSSSSFQSSSLLL